MQKIKKILVVRLSSLGDIILSFPLLKKLREKFPESEIHFLTKKKFAEALSLNPDVKKIILFDEKLTVTRNLIISENYDLVIDIHKNFRSRFLSTFINAPVVRYKKESVKKFLLVNFKLNLFKEIIPVYKKYILSVKNLLGSDDFDFTVSDIHFDKTKIVAGNYFVISPATRHFTKTYPADKFIKYINGLNSKGDIKVVLVGDNTESDMKICDYITANCQGVINLCGKLNLEELANVLSFSKKIICNDSAILHLSEALGKGVTAIFGSTVKEFGFFPQLKESGVLEITNLKCRPCTHIGRESCPEKHFKCMKEIQLS